MINKNMIFSWVILFGLVGLAACGSKTADDPVSNNSKVVIGAITGFGSVYVNGVEYESDAAEISEEGNKISEDDLAIGMVVKITGDDNGNGTGKAHKIEYNDNIEGIVVSNSVNAGVGTLNVMGQTVKVDADTKYESENPTYPSIETIPVNAVVEVSGFDSGNGEIVATRIELKSASYTEGEEIELKGVVGPNPTDTEFKIGSLTIDYSNADKEDLPNGIVTEGLYVEVKSNTAIDTDTMTLVATKVELENEGKMGHHGEDGDELEFEGVVAEIISESEFILNGQHVVHNAETLYQDGAAADITVGIKLEVHGKMVAGEFVATKIEFRQEAETKMEGYVEATDLEGDTGLGKVTVMGIAVTVNTMTRMEDKRNDGVEPVRYFSLKDVVINDRIDLDIYNEDGTGWVAKKMERVNDKQDEVRLQGTVDSIDTAEGTFVIAGITVKPDTLGTIVVGDKIEAKGTYTAGVFTATEISPSNS